MAEQSPLFWVEDKVEGDSPSPAFASRHPGGSPSHAQVRKMGKVMCQALRHGLDVLSTNDPMHAQFFEELKKTEAEEGGVWDEGVEWFGLLAYRGRFVALIGRQIERRDLCEVWGDTGALQALGWATQDAQGFWEGYLKRFDAALERVEAEEGQDG